MREALGGEISEEGQRVRRHAVEYSCGKHCLREPSAAQKKETERLSAEE